MMLKEFVEIDEVEVEVEVEVGVEAFVAMVNEKCLEFRITIRIRSPEVNGVV